MKPYPVAHLPRHIIVLAVLLTILLSLSVLTHTPAQASSSTATSATTPEVVASINRTFGRHAPAALRVAYCESGYNPYAFNRSSAASGVFQIIPGTWAGTSKRWYSPFNAWANIAAAHEIFVRDGYSWREWACQPW